MSIRHVFYPHGGFYDFFCRSVLPHLSRWARLQLRGTCRWFYQAMNTVGFPQFTCSVYDLDNPVLNAFAAKVAKGVRDFRLQSYYPETQTNIVLWSLRLGHLLGTVFETACLTKLCLVQCYWHPFMATLPQLSTLKLAACNRGSNVHALICDLSTVRDCTTLRALHCTLVHYGVLQRHLQNGSFAHLRRLGIDYKIKRDADEYLIWRHERDRTDLSFLHTMPHLTKLTLGLDVYSEEPLADLLTPNQQQQLHTLCLNTDPYFQHLRGIPALKTLKVKDIASSTLSRLLDHAAPNTLQLEHLVIDEPWGAKIPTFIHTIDINAPPSLYRVTFRKVNRHWYKKAKATLKLPERIHWDFELTPRGLEGWYPTS